MDGLDTQLSFRLKRDEAVVLFWYLSREILERDGERLGSSFENSAEPIALEALFHELLPSLSGPDTPEYVAEHVASIEHLLARFK